MTGDEPVRAATANWRVVARRVAFIAVIVAQLSLVVRAYWAPHMEFGYQMFPEASTWQAEIVRVTHDGERIPVSEPWSGYEWAALVDDQALADFDRRRHANAGVDNQVALLDEALEWVAANTPRDAETRYLEADVTTWFNDDGPTVTIIRSPDRETP